MQKTKFLILSLLLSFISCDLLLNGELKDKSNNLLDKVYSILDFTQHNDSNNENSQNNITNADISSSHIDASSMPQTVHHTSSYKKNTTGISEDSGIPHIDGTSIPQMDNTNKKNQDIYTPIQIDLDITPLTETVNTIVVDAYKKLLPPLNHYSESSNKTNNLKSMSGESSINYNDYNVDYDIYNYIPPTTIISGLYSGSMTIEEDEFEEGDDTNEKEETRLDNQYKFKLNKTKDSVKKALKLAGKIKDDWEKVEFHKTKLNPSYGRRPEDSEKQQSQHELYKFNKNKLTEDLKNLLSTIEESLNNAIHLTNIPEYAGNLQKDIQSKTKLEKIKSETNTLLSKVQKSHEDDYQAYKKIESSNNMHPKTKSELELVLKLLDGTTGAR
uniref:Fibronectin-binding protein B n=1 Tax=Borrelia parkeri TaxID=141 RepID=S5MGH6_BORPR|nr:fibronectin-binding protein B [Borrelia parkeri]